MIFAVCRHLQYFLPARLHPDSLDLDGPLHHFGYTNRASPLVRVVYLLCQHVPDGVSFAPASLLR
jgi:hypothetical protein